MELDSHKLLAMGGPPGDCKMFGEYIQKNLVRRAAKNKNTTTATRAFLFFHPFHSTLQLTLQSALVFHFKFSGCASVHTILSNAHSLFNAAAAEHHNNSQNNDTKQQLTNTLHTYLINAPQHLYEHKNDLKLTTAAAANFTRNELASSLRTRNAYQVNL
jgi:hypothetical protein